LICAYPVYLNTHEALSTFKLESATGSATLILVSPYTNSIANDAAASFLKAAILFPY